MKRPAAKTIVTALAAAALAGCTHKTVTDAGSPAAPGRPAAVDLYVRGAQAYQAGKNDDAVRSLEAAVKQNPDLLMARAMLGDIYRQRSEYEAAAKQYEVLSERDPYTLSNHYNLGVSYQFLDRFRESAVAYLKGLRLDPNDFKSNMNLGAVYLALGQIDDAVNYLDKATQLDSTSAVAWSNLGVALDARRSLVLAETSYRKSLELDSTSLPTMKNLGSNLITQKKAIEATVIWRQVIPREKNAFTLKRLGDAFTLAKDYSKAHENYDEALKLDPRSIAALNDKANAYILEYDEGLELDPSKRDQAVALWKRSLALNGSQTRVQELVTKWSGGPRFGK